MYSSRRSNSFYFDYPRKDLNSYNSWSTVLTLLDVESFRIRFQVDACSKDNFFPRRLSVIISDIGYSESRWDRAILVRQREREKIVSIRRENARNFEN